jgi:uncharacterized membrane protein YjfL (UPF0719 family)
MFRGIVSKFLIDYAASIPEFITYHKLKVRLVAMFVIVYKSVTFHTEFSVARMLYLVRNFIFLATNIP